MPSEGKAGFSQANMHGSNPWKNEAVGNTQADLRADFNIALIVFGIKGDLVGTDINKAVPGPLPKVLALRYGYGVIKYFPWKDPEGRRERSLRRLTSIITCKTVLQMQHVVLQNNTNVAQMCGRRVIIARMIGWACRQKNARSAEFLPCCGRTRSPMPERFNGEGISARGRSVFPDPGASGSPEAEAGGSGPRSGRQACRIP